jgi:hemolysin-activating ACP:hemolysin acyltransferase
MTSRSTKTFVPVALLAAAIAATAASPQQISKAVKVVQLTGLPGMKENAKGILSVENGNLHFVHAKAISDVSASLIQDVVTGSDSQEAVGKTVGIISMAAPYGGGRFLSLFRNKIDTLTVEYRDADGAFHGAIFTMPVGTAEEIKKELIAQGAHTSSSTSADKEQKQ